MGSGRAKPYFENIIKAGFKSGHHNLLIQLERFAVNTVTKNWSLSILLLNVSNTVFNEAIHYGIQRM